MLFVDDDESEARELDVGLDQLVRADDEIDFAGRQLDQYRLDFLRRSKARQLGQFHGQIREAIREDLQVLLRQ